MKKIRNKTLSVLGIVCVASAAMAAETTLTVEATKDGFKPAMLQIPADQKVKLVLKNSDTAEVEFESYELNREVKIAPGAQKEIFIGPLKAGSYAFFDDLNPGRKVMSSLSNLLIDKEERNEKNTIDNNTSPFIFSAPSKSRVF